MQSALLNTGRPVSLGYLANLSADIARTTLLVLITIDALFLSDAIVSRVLPELLAYDAGIESIALVVLYAAPNGLFIALPTALLVGVYIVVLRRREDQEFKIFAGLGYSPRALTATALLVGLLGAAASIGLSGFVEPPARFLLRTTLQNVAQEAVREGELTSGRFYQVGDTTLYAASGRLNKVAGDVFLYQRRPEGVARVIVASQLFNAQTSQQSQRGVLLSNANIYEFADQPGQHAASKQVAAPDCMTCEPEQVLPPLKQLKAERLYMKLPKASLTFARDRRGPEETNLYDLVSMRDWNPKDVQVLGERLLRAALCIVTPLLALVAVTLTFESTLLLALPSAAALVLVLSFFASNNVGLISHYGIWAMAGGISGGTIAICGLCVFLVQKLNSNFIRSIGVSV